MCFENHRVHACAVQALQAVKFDDVGGISADSIAAVQQAMSHALRRGRPTHSGAAPSPATGGQSVPPTVGVVPWGLDAEHARCSRHASLPPHHSRPMTAARQALSRSAEPGTSRADGAPSRAPAVPRAAAAPTDLGSAPQSWPAPPLPPPRSPSPRSRSPSERFKALGVVLEADERTQTRLAAAARQSAGGMHSTDSGAGLNAGKLGSDVQHGAADAHADDGCPSQADMLVSGQPRTAVGAPYMPLGRDYPDGSGASTRVQSPTRCSGVPAASM